MIAGYLAIISPMRAVRQEPRVIADANTILRGETQCVNRLVPRFQTQVGDLHPLFGVRM